MVRDSTACDPFLTCFSDKVLFNTFTLLYNFINKKSACCYAC